jgi:hypothetical protein
MTKMTVVPRGRPIPTTVIIALYGKYSVRYILIEVKVPSQADEVEFNEIMSKEWLPG